MSELSELQRRVTLLEGEVEGEKRVSRHILRKVTENETLLLEVKQDVAELRRDLGDLRNEVVLLRADLPGIIATVVGALLREMKEKG